MQRNRPRDAAQFFNSAVKAKPDYAPALLNLAIVEQTYLGDRQAALQRYHDYLAVTPTPPDAEAVLQPEALRAWAAQVRGAAAEAAVLRA